MKSGTVTSARGNRKIHWGGMLFGLVFFSVWAAFLLLIVLPNLWDAFRMREWVQVPAEVEAVDLKTSCSDDSTTYKVTARFCYDLNGYHYSGDRIGIADGGADNVGDWQQNTYARLKRQQQTRLWVNPGKPSESVFDRELRWGLLGFKLIFVVCLAASAPWLFICH